MSRKLLIDIHLYLATFFAPIILMLALSGGLYLLGIKGTVEKQQIYQAAATEFNREAEDIKKEVTRILAMADVDADFEYVKVSGNKYITRPTSRIHYVIQAGAGKLTVTKESPDLVKTLVELHKGHGPLIFKTFQKFTALGLLLILITGLWLGFSSKVMRNKTLGLTGGGLVFFLIFALL